jgi:hypothetical protein
VVRRDIDSRIYDSGGMVDGLEVGFENSGGELGVGENDISLSCAKLRVASGASSK